MSGPATSPLPLLGKAVEGERGIWAATLGSIGNPYAAAPAHSIPSRSALELGESTLHFHLLWRWL